MKTYNNHPIYYNEPIRLNEEQTKNPDLVFDEFFQCYHLNEVRQTMWQWLVTVVSGADSASKDPHERNNDMFFYEQIEMLVEGVWVLQRKGGQMRVSDTNVSDTCIGNTKDANSSRFSKPMRLVEKAHSHPEEVIKEAFSEVSWRDLYEYLLPTWLRVAVVSSESPYSDGDGREVLYAFYDQLLAFVEALYIIYEAPEGHNPNCLSEEQLADPRRVVSAFFQQFTIEYIRRELHDFLDAALGYDGVYPNGFTPWQAWMVYGQVVCLVEGAWRTRCC
ncbi:hypothetical protein [Niastella sp. OAS944]|uniref:hypothetical protein n=1 Tax=Niastella sp. OAS944 TaxID=2664089 RepID=UPI003491B60F|nr:hypothetical protein [Chitinophagaceae bacterium OAS944]